mgnify:CR=1 FL=1
MPTNSVLLYSGAPTRASLHLRRSASEGYLREISHHHVLEEEESHHSTVCRSEEHTSELQSLVNLVCRLLLEKKKKKCKLSHFLKFHVW